MGLDKHGGENYMLIRSFEIDNDYEYISNWIEDERTHAMWCANLIPYPMDKDSFRRILSDMAEKYGDESFAALDDEERLIGF